MRMIGSMPTLRFSWIPGLALLDLVVVLYLASPADFSGLASPRLNFSWWYFAHQALRRLTALSATYSSTWFFRRESIAPALERLPFHLKPIRQLELGDRVLFPEPSAEITQK